jgi:general secretion pathway protein G
MLIVIVVIAILALIVIPRLLSAGRRAKEAALRGDLQQLRNAVQQFEADCGDYPAALSALMGATLAAGNGGGGIALDTTGYKGPYLRTGDGTLPKDPFTNSNAWTYVGSTGSVHSASTLTGLDGTNYSNW